MTDAPEKIWLDEPEDGAWWALQEPTGLDNTEYVRADLAQAMVAAAYEAWAKDLQKNFRKVPTDIAAWLAARDQQDGPAALEALLKAEREKALREAAAVARGVGGLPENTGSPPSDFNNEGYNLAANDAADTILALIDK